MNEDAKSYKNNKFNKDGERETYSNSNSNTKSKTKLFRNYSEY